MGSDETIYVELLDEAVTVYRPVVATRLADGLFLLPPESPSDERWLIAPGSQVECELRDLGGGRPVLVAVRQRDS